MRCTVERVSARLMWKLKLGMGIWVCVIAYGLDSENSEDTSDILDGSYLMCWDFCRASQLSCAGSPGCECERLKSGECRRKV